MLPSSKMNEANFTPMFLANCSDLELVGLQHELRRFPEDRGYLNQVLEELRKRQGQVAPLTGEPR